MTFDTLDPDLDPRRAAILGAAFQTFCRYGFKRTAMDDIARAAGLSRAGLYQHYRNKQDIFRSLTQLYFDVTTQRARQALTPALPPQVALKALFDAKAGPELEAMFASPHGQELLDEKFSTSADIATAGIACLAAILADWLHAEAAAGRLSLDAAGNDAPGFARTLLAAVEGLKTPDGGIEAYRRESARLAAVIGRGLLP